MVSMPSILQTSLLLVLALVGRDGVAASNSGPEVKRFTAFTRPLKLTQGEITNTFHRLEIPKGPIAVYRFEADVVEKDADGNVIPVPIFDAYLHHHVVGSNHKAYQQEQNKWAPMKPESFSRSVGFGAGTECRGTPQQFYYPYAFVTVEGEDEWIANVHVLNTRKMTPARKHQCLECPCTSADEHTATAVNGQSFAANGCNAELLAENNTVCSAATYHGGLRCCEDSMFCLETDVLDASEPASTYYLRYSIEYSEVVPAIRPLYLAGCCDASGDLSHHGNIEYDLPACDEKRHPGCVHTLSTRQRLDHGANSVYQLMQGNGDLPDRDVELVFAVGHQHRAGLGLNVYNDATGELICSSVPEYGSGTEIGNEDGYVVAMSTCTFDPPMRLRSSDVLRIVSLYNNTVAHTGVMALMYLAISDVTDSEVATLSSSASEVEGFLSSPFVMAGAAAGAIAAAVLAVVHVKRRRGYAPVTSPTAVNE